MFPFGGPVTVKTPLPAVKAESDQALIHVKRVRYCAVFH